MTSRNKLFAGIGIGALVVAFILGWWLGSPSGETAEPHDHETTVAEGEQTAAATEWTCSMHPQVRQPDPGQCPICGMDLIPASADDDPSEDSDLPQLRVSERSAALMNVQTWPVERRIVEREVRLLGRVNYDETRQRTITAWIPGRIDRLFVNVEGARVEQGDPVAELYSPALISAQEELLQALRTARQRETEDAPMVEAARDRLRLLGLAADQIQEIEDRGRVEDHIVIHSPLDGVITERIAVEGMYVEAGDRIAALAALDRVFLDLEAYERDLPWLAEGQKVRFTVEGISGETFEGRLDQINPFVDPQRRTALARVTVENPDDRLKPGMYGRGRVVARVGDPEEEIDLWREEPPLIIPTTAALITGRRAIVYVNLPDTDRPTFQLRQVTLGPRAGDHYIVTDGLSEGELVVTNGNFKIDSELQLRGQPSMMAPPETPEEPLSPEIAPDHPALSLSPEDVPQDIATEASQLIESYFLLTDALAEDNFSEAHQAVTRLDEQIAAVDARDLSGAVARAWTSLSPRIHESVRAMAEGENLDDIREHLEALTNQMELVVRSLAAGEVYPVYRVNCPMAFDDEGADWLQLDEEIANPYFGASMLRCGEILAQVAPDPAEETEDIDPEELHSGAPSLVSPEDVPAEFGEQLGRVVDHYLELTAHLAADEFQPAQTAASEMAEALEEIDPELLDENAREEWHVLHQEILTPLNEITTATEISRIREMLQPLTNAIETGVESYHAGQISPVYEAYCPMAFDDQGGTWLQAGSDIQNAYFGDAMFACGEIVSRLP